MATITRLSTTDHRAIRQQQLERLNAHQGDGPFYPAHARSLPRYLPIDRSIRRSSIEIYRSNIDLITSDTSVILSNSDLLHGVTKEGKNWYRWDTPRKKILTVKPNSKGQMRANFYNYTSYNGMKNYISLGRDDPFFSDHWESVSSLFAAQMPEIHAKIEEKQLELVRDRIGFYLFPGFLVTQNMSTDSLGVPYRFRYTFRSDNAIDMAISAFGKKHYRKDIVKSLATSTQKHNVSLAMYIRHLMKTDWLVEMMRTEEDLEFHFNPHDEVPFKQFAKILSNIPENRRRRFVLSLGRYNTYHNDDAVRMSTWLQDGDYARVRTIGDLHDIGRQRQRERYAFNPAPRLIAYEEAPLGGGQRAWTPPKPVEEIELNDLCKTFHETTTKKGLKLIAPTHAKDLKEWGEYMHNCIGGYADKADSGQSNLGGVYDGDKLIANFEISQQRQVRQLLGRFNRNLDFSVQCDIIETLLANDSIVLDGVANAWGADPRLASLQKTKDK